MPDDMGAGSPANSVTSTDQREKSCDFGSCTFVLTWHQINGEGGISKNDESNIVRNSAAICPTCGGLFTKSTLLLQEMKLGAIDKVGRTVQQIYPSGEDYMIYRTRQGVSVHFADCRACEREQRAEYLYIAEKLCRLRFLTSQMARGFGTERFNRTGGFYDHQIAEAICLTLQGRQEKAIEILDDGLSLANVRLNNEKRIHYLVACLLTGLVPAGALLVAYLSGAFIFEDVWIPNLLAAAAGAAGAVFSIAMRVQTLELKACAQSVMN